MNVGLYSNKHQLHGCTVTICFLILDLYLFVIKFKLENGEDPDQLADQNSNCILGEVILIKFGIKCITFSMIIIDKYFEKKILYANEN